MFVAWNLQTDVSTKIQTIAIVTCNMGDSYKKIMPNLKSMNELISMISFIKVPLNKVIVSVC